MGVKTLLRSNCKFWSREKEGATGEMGDSEIGPDPVTTGTIAFDAGKYGDRFDRDQATANTNYPEWVDALAQTNTLIFEIWIKPDFNFPAVKNFVIFEALTSNDGSGKGVICYANNAFGGFPGGWIVQMRNGAGGTDLSLGFTDSWTAGDEFHLRLKLNNVASAGSRIELRKDGNVLTQSFTGSDNTWNYVTNTTVWGARAFVGGTGGGVLSNLKIYDDISSNTQNGVTENKDFEGFKDNQALIV